jgi:CheY-like chemotaxis protein
MSKTILIVQHDELYLTMMELRLEMEGLHTILSRSPEEGIRLCRHQSPDLVLVATKMPTKIPGEIIAQLKATNPGVKILPANFSSSKSEGGSDENEGMDVVFDQLAQLEMLVNDVKTALGLESDILQN